MSTRWKCVISYNFDTGTAESVVLQLFAKKCKQGNLADRGRQGCVDDAAMQIEEPSDVTVEIAEDERSHGGLRRTSGHRMLGRRCPEIVAPHRGWHS